MIIWLLFSSLILQAVGGALQPFDLAINYLFAGRHANFTKAINLIQNSAAGGDVAPNHLLSVIYGFGIGVPVDVSRSSLFRNVAAAGNHPPALAARGWRVALDSSHTMSTCTTAVGDLVRAWRLAVPNCSEAHPLLASHSHTNLESETRLVRLLATTGTPQWWKLALTARKIAEFPSSFRVPGSALQTLRDYAVLSGNRQTIIRPPSFHAFAEMTRSTDLVRVALLARMARGHGGLASMAAKLVFDGINTTQSLASVCRHLATDGADVWTVRTPHASVGSSFFLGDSVSLPTDRASDRVVEECTYAVWLYLASLASKRSQQPTVGAFGATDVAAAVGIAAMALRSVGSHAHRLLTPWIVAEAAGDASFTSGITTIPRANFESSTTIANATAHLLLGVPLTLRDYSRGWFDFMDASELLASEMVSKINQIRVSLDGGGAVSSSELTTTTTSSSAGAAAAAAAASASSSSSPSSASSSSSSTATTSPSPSPPVTCAQWAESTQQLARGVISYTAAAAKAREAASRLHLSNTGPSFASHFAQWVSHGGDLFALAHAFAQTDGEGVTTLRPSVSTLLGGGRRASEASLGAMFRQGVGRCDSDAVLLAVAAAAMAVDVHPTTSSTGTGSAASSSTSAASTSAGSATGASNAAATTASTASSRPCSSSSSWHDSKDLMRCRAVITALRQAVTSVTVPAVFTASHGAAGCAVLTRWIAAASTTSPPAPSILNIEHLMNERLTQITQGVVPGRGVGSVVTTLGADVVLLASLVDVGDPLAASSLARFTRRVARVMHLNDVGHRPLPSEVADALRAVFPNATVTAAVASSLSISLNGQGVGTAPSTTATDGPAAFSLSQQMGRSVQGAKVASVKVYSAVDGFRGAVRQLRNAAQCSEPGMQLAIVESGWLVWLAYQLLCAGVSWPWVRRSYVCI